MSRIKAGDRQAAPNPRVTAPGAWKSEGKLQPAEEVDRGARRKEGGRSDGVVSRLRPRCICGERPRDEIAVVVERRRSQDRSRVVAMIQQVIHLNE